VGGRGAGFPRGGGQKAGLGPLKTEGEGGGIFLIILILYFELELPRSACHGPASARSMEF
jgi:hypothetical protein